ncbi:MAG: YggT family protein [Gammaproteobacteria bacterium]|nr:YggT family protein [Gammaproteobacteria bacterium]
MTDTLVFIVKFVLQAASLVFLLRFLLQAVRADAYNPITEAIVKLSWPVLRYLRYVLPTWRNLDFAAFGMAWGINALLLVIMATHRDLPFSALVVIGDTLRATVSLAIGVFLVAIFATIVMSWIAPGTRSPATSLIHDVAEPLLAPARKLIPPIGGTLDLSPMLTVLVLLVIQGPVLSAVLPYQIWQFV